MRTHSFSEEIWMDDEADFLGLIVATGLISRDYWSHVLLPGHVMWHFAFLHVFIFIKSHLKRRFWIPVSFCQNQTGVLFKFIEVRAV